MKKKQNIKIIIGIIIFIIIFAWTFYMFFTYTVVLYMSKNIFILNFIFGFLMDFIIYEGFMNLLLVIFYANTDRKNSGFRNLFLFRAFRNCL